MSARFDAVYARAIEGKTVPVSFCAARCRCGLTLSSLIAVAFFQKNRSLGKGGGRRSIKSIFRVDTIVCVRFKRVLKISFHSISRLTILFTGVGWISKFLIRKRKNIVFRVILVLLKNYRD